jgi:hypothetical protein
MVYLELARQEFLEGTTSNIPAEAVESGERLIEQWCDCVELHRREYFDLTDKRGANKLSGRSGRSVVTVREARGTR